MNDIDVGLLIFRLVLGGTIIAHGLNHWRGGGKVAGTARWFESLGLRPGVVHAWMSIVTEVGCGLALVVGLLTPLSAGAVLGTMLVAGVIEHRKNGYFIFRNGYEYVLMIGVLLVGLATTGAGRVSVDHALGLPGTHGWIGALAAAVVGLGGGAALLSVAWRPAHDATSA